MKIRAVVQKFLNYETISYLILGFLTTAVDYGVFALVNELFKARGMKVAESSAIATVIAWIAAVLFAYVTNKLIVFRSFDFHPDALLKECAGFFTARAISGVITLVLMFLLTGCLGLNEYLAKVFTSAFNVVFNYVASKFFVFKK